jgi:hypothetical protein
MRLEQTVKFAEPNICELLDNNLAQKKVYVKPDGDDVIRDACLNFNSGYYIFASGANIGKTNTLIGIGTKSLILGDFSVLYLSIDDSAQDISYRMMACLMEHLEPNLPVKVPCWAMRYMQTNPEKEAVRHTAHQVFTKFINSGKLSIYDSNSCRNFQHIAKEIEQRKDEKLLVIIDGVLLIDVPGKQYKTEFDKNEYRANELKRMAVKYDIPLLTSHEIIKQKDQKGYDLSSLKGSGRFGYNANFVCLLIPDEKDKNLVNCDIVKNKICATKKRFMMRINPDQSSFYYV